MRQCLSYFPEWVLFDGGGLFFEEPGDQRRGLFGEFVGALMDEGDEGSADFGGEEGAVGCPWLAL